MTAEVNGHDPRFQEVLELIGRRWTGMILFALLTGSLRFSQIVAAVPGISDRLTDERLTELVEIGLVARDEENRRSVSYRLTPAGEAVGPVLRSVQRYVEEWWAYDCRPGTQRPVGANPTRRMG